MLFRIKGNILNWFTHEGEEEANREFHLEQEMAVFTKHIKLISRYNIIISNTWIYPIINI